MDTTMTMISLGGGLALLAVLAGGLTLGFERLLPGWSRKRRKFWAAAVAVMAPMSLVFAAYIRANSMVDAAPFVIGLFTLTAITLFLGLVVCLPAAWFVDKRLGEVRPVAVEFDDEPELVRVENRIG